MRLGVKASMFQAIKDINAWGGAGFMVAASFNMGNISGPTLAIMGLTMLSFQAWQARLFNLVCLNAASIVGFGFSLNRML